MKVLIFCLFPEKISKKLESLCAVLLYFPKWKRTQFLNFDFSFFPTFSQQLHGVFFWFSICTVSHIITISILIY